MRDVTSIRSLILSDITLVNATTLAIAFVIAETFYKFHSFTLEAGAFLATWYVLRVVARFATRST